VDQARFAVGLSYSDALARELRSRSGVETLRVLRPDDVVTLTYGTHRLTVHLDGSGRVQQLACG
jgi:hypothetical protein